MAAGLSAVIPGLGQAVNRDARLAAIFAAPLVVVVVITWLLLQLNSPTRLLASLIVPSTLTVLLVLNGLFLLWRLAAVGQAFLDRRFTSNPTGRGWLGLVLVMGFVAAPHAFGQWVGTTGLATFDRVFDSRDGPQAAPTGPGVDERLNVLLVGIDAEPGRTAELTDTLIVVSLDPVGDTVTMVSIPRDMVNVPLGNGDTYGPKINSLLGYVDRNPDEFPQGGFEALEGAIGSLLGIDIHYHVEADLAGFVRMVDAVGGVEVDVKRALDDPKYTFEDGRKGWSVAPGRRHFSGYDALAYARIRRTPGENDFTRAERQQQILVAIRNAAVRGDNLLFRLPALMDAVGDSMRTDMPVDRLPELAAIAEEVDGGRTVRIVIRHPLVRPATNRYGAVQVPDVVAIRQVAARAFSQPGVPPQPWPTPEPSPGASGGAGAP